MKVRSKKSGKEYQIYGISSSEFGRYGNFEAEPTRYLIWDFGYKWVDKEHFEVVK